MYRVEVIADNSGEWCSNGLAFDTYAQAYAYGDNLFMRWTAVREWHVIDATGAVVTGEIATAA